MSLASNPNTSMSNLFELIKQLVVILTMTTSPGQLVAPKAPQAMMVPQAAPLAAHETVYVVALAGQSQAAGWDSYLADNPSPSIPTNMAIPRTQIFDKYARDNFKNFDLVDYSRNGEPHGLRPLTVGYCGTSPKYPWENLSLNPMFGPEMSMAHKFTSQRRGQLLICKAAFGGTVVKDFSGDDWNPSQLAGGISYTEVFLQAYWNPIIDKAVALAGGDRSRVKILGIVWMQGFSDGRELAQAQEYAQNAHMVLSAMRAGMGVEDPDSIPIRIWQTADSPQPDWHPHIPIIQQQQTMLVTGSGSQYALPNCSLESTSDLPVNPASSPHFSAQGYDMLGQRKGNWLRTLPGVVINP